MPLTKGTPQKDYLITDSTDIVLAVQAAATQSNVGAALNVNIPANGIIKFDGFSGRIIESTVQKTTVSFGLRIGSTNYWFDEWQVGGVVSYAGMFFCGLNTTHDYYGMAASPESSAAANLAYPSGFCMDVAGKGIPSGNQTVQLIAGKSGAGVVTLKGTVRQTRSTLRING